MSSHAPVGFLPSRFVPCRQNLHIWRNYKRALFQFLAQPNLQQKYISITLILHYTALAIDSLRSKSQRHYFPCLLQ